MSKIVKAKVHGTPRASGGDPDHIIKGLSKILYSPRKRG